MFVVLFPSVSRSVLIAHDVHNCTCVADLYGSLRWFYVAVGRRAPSQLRWGCCTSQMIHSSKWPSMAIIQLHLRRNALTIGRKFEFWRTTAWCAFARNRCHVNTVAYFSIWSVPWSITSVRSLYLVLILYMITKYTLVFLFRHQHSSTFPVSLMWMMSYWLQSH